MAKSKKTTTAVSTGVIVLALAGILARFGLGLPGLGGGNGALGTGSGQGNGSESAAVTMAAEENETLPEKMETSAGESTEAVTEADDSQTETETVIEIEEENGQDETNILEYTIEIRKDQYLIDGFEVSEQQIEELLKDGNVSFKIDNNYGSQKAVSRLKELFISYNIPFVD